VAAWSGAQAKNSATGGLRAPFILRFATFAHFALKKMIRLARAEKADER
jgi:hypothetical protein